MIPNYDQQNPARSVQGGPADPGSARLLFTLFTLLAYLNWALRANTTIQDGKETEKSG